ncbi:MAG TPA: glycosyltransferase [Candidatus Paceibacterota bacterium]|nr:glycosyltransferase [Candidatus Paceibacterota bacterium]
MNTLFISNDPSVFDSASPTRARMRAYAGHIGNLAIVSRGNPAQVREYGAGVQEGGLTLYAVGGGKIAGLSALLNCARKVIRERGIEVVSAQDPFEHGWVALKAVKGTNARLHVQVHTDFCSPWFVKGKAFRSKGMPMPLLNRIRVRIAGRVLPKAHGIRTVSERVKEGILARYPDLPIVPSVIPIAVESALPPSVELPPRPYTFTFITVGRLEPEKRIEDILDALARVKDMYPSVGLIVVGEGRARAHLERLVRSFGLEGRVMFLGARPDALGLMQSAQAYIQASGYEGYGRTLIEAALARIPIITTDVGIVGEVLNGYDDVLAAPPGDPAALAVHISGIIEDVQARSSLVMNAERKAKAHLAGFADLPELIAADLAATLHQP